MRGLIVAIVGALLAINGWAEQKERFGPYDVHYSVVNTTFLKPDVAKSYGIVRGSDRFILNISVRENLDDGTNVARKAAVSGTRFNLIHREKLNFKEIDERTAVYYIAPVQADHKETLDFTLSIKPDTSPRAYKLQFNKVMYNDQ